MIRDRQARALYFALQAIPDYQFLLLKDAILNRCQFYWRTGKIKGAVIAYGLTVVVALFFLLPLGAALKAHRNVSQPYISYFYVWRVAKANTTDADKFRTNEQLVAYLADPATASNVCSELSALLRYEPLTTNAADRDLAILLAGNPAGAGCHEALHDLLIDALRAQNSDVRSRINHSLVWLYSREKTDSISTELKNWKPKPNEPAYVIQDYIAKWRLAWSMQPASKQQVPSPPKAAP